MKLIRLSIQKVKADLLETWAYLFLLLILNIAIMSRYIGYSSGGIKETLVLYFMGSNRINTSFFMWLFLQTCIIGFYVHKIKIDINNVLGFYFVKFKNAYSYVVILLIRMFLDVVIYYSFLYLGVYIYLRLFYRTLNTIYVFQSIIHFNIENVMVILLGTSILNTVIFILMICIVGIYVHSLSNSYLILQIYQLCILFFSQAIGNALKFIPLVQGVFILYDNLNVLIFSFVYQLVLIIILSIALLKLITIKIEELV